LTTPQVTKRESVQNGQCDEDAQNRLQSVAE
jgi:hypothetical protein